MDRLPQIARKCGADARLIHSITPTHPRRCDRDDAARDSLTRRIFAARRGLSVVSLKLVVDRADRAWARWGAVKAGPTWVRAMAPCAAALVAP